MPMIYRATAGGGSVGFIVYLTVLLGVTLVAALVMREGSPARSTREAALRRGEVGLVVIMSRLV